MIHTPVETEGRNEKAVIKRKPHFVYSQAGGKTSIILRHSNVMKEELLSILMPDTPHSFKKKNCVSAEDREVQGIALVWGCLALYSFFRVIS